MPEIKKNSLKSMIDMLRRNIDTFRRLGFAKQSSLLNEEVSAKRVDAVEEIEPSSAINQIDGAKESNFDAIFYRKYNHDLANIPDDGDLLTHFIQFGIAEGRPANAKAMIESLEGEYGPLPANFNAYRYRNLHADLALKFEVWELQEHYLRYGQFEKRLYGEKASIYENEFRVLKIARAGTAPSIAYEQRFRNFGAMLEASHVFDGSWLDRFSLYEFVLLNAHWLPHKPSSRMEGIVLFLEQGIERLAPIALDARFDPLFYRERVTGTLREASNVDLYRDWLSRGVEVGEPCSEAEVLNQLLRTETFPACFDPEAYRLATARDTEITFASRLHALEHYVQLGFSNFSASFSLPSDSDAAALLERIGEHHLARSNFEKAKQAFDAAIFRVPGNSRLHHRRGDTLKLLLRPREAAEDFVIAANAPGSVLWSHIHAAEGLANVLGQLDAAFERVKRSAPNFRGDPRWRAAAHGVLNKMFANTSGEASDLYRAKRRIDGDRKLTDLLDLLVETIPLIDPLPALLPASRKNLIVMIANRDLPQCEHYRVEQKRRQLIHGGWTVKIFDQSDATSARTTINSAAAVIFYRVAAFPPIVHMILYARALGVPTIYEIDDLIFDAKEFPDPFESFEGQISEHDYVGLQYGVPLFRYAMQLCDIGLASTPALADAVGKLVQKGVCYVLRNGLDQRNLPFLTRRRPHLDVEAPLTVFYGSGTKAHNKDFTDLAAPALLKVLRQYPNVRVVVAGYLLLDDRFAPYAHRVREIGFTSDVTSYWEALSGVDINLAVLACTPMSDAKSEIKWLEAAMCGVPSIVSNTRTYRELLTHGEDALLAATAEEWSDALDQLVRDHALREKIGKTARTHATSKYGLDQAVEVLRQLLPSPIPHTRPSASSDRNCKFSDTEFEAESHLPRSRNRPRILIVNVYFPPQSIGGATRVVQNNLDEFLDRGGSHYEYAIAAVDEHSKESNDAEAPLETRIDSYRGVPIYRIAAPLERNMIWRPYNPRMRQPFDELLDRFEPDLVHFHCVQRLTVTVVEAVHQRFIPYIITLHDAWWISDFQFLVDESGQVHKPSSDPFVDATDPALSATESIGRRIRLKRALDGARDLLAVSETFAELYRSAGFPQTKTVANGVPHLHKEPRPPSTTQQVRLGHIGGRTAHKGATLIEIVLRAGHFPNLTLTLVDHAESSSYRRNEFWGETPVEIIGFVPSYKISNLYAQLDVLLAPSLWPESFGLVAREAREAGLWVVASDRGAIGEDLEDGNDGFRIDVDGPEELQAVLTRLNDEAARFRQRPPKPKQPVRTMADQARDLIAIYDDLLLS